jgi:hypothetical protein
VRAYVKAIDGVWLFSLLSGKRAAALEPGDYRLSTRLDPNPLRPGRYVFDLGLQTALPQDFVEDALGLEVEPSLDAYDDPVLRGDTGRLRIDSSWTTPERLT